MSTTGSQPRSGYDVLVIGGGAAGENAADIAARSGLRVGLIEHELLGGDCTFWACMPSKALLRPGEALDAVRRTPGAAAGGAIDVGEALDRRDALASGWDDSEQVSWLEDAGVDLIRGHGRLAEDRQVSVDLSEGGAELFEVERAVVVATGAVAALPPITGLDEAGVWTYREATSAKEAPRRLLVIGGGAVGTEMAQAWKWLGSEEVTLVEVSDRLLSDEEEFAGAELRESLTRMGVVVHTSATTESVRREGSDGPVIAEVDLEDGSREVIEADEILLATGRKPATTDLGLETVGLEPGEAIEVDDHLRAKGVPGEWLYAVGDVNGRAMLTHSGKYQARIAGAHIGGLETSAWGDVKAAPRVVFTSPEVAATGLTESQAAEEDIEIRTVTYDMANLAAAPILGRGYGGTCKLVVDAEREVIVGATFVGPRAGEMIHAATIAIAGEVPLSALWHAIPSFPTFSEIWLRLLESYRDEFNEVFT
jgi:pyruvate/2-oxoglutarate dehydrogenase complex dihydrolipoamide dehydrogenase (E3) component